MNMDDMGPPIEPELPKELKDLVDNLAQEFSLRRDRDLADAAPATVAAMNTSIERLARIVSSATLPVPTPNECVPGVHRKLMAQMQAQVEGEMNEHELKELWQCMALLRNMVHSIMRVSREKAHVERLLRGLT